jgi:DNA invertase Pin-like site-specific DNA recombinase
MDSKAISSADKANVISLLLSGHSIRKVESITGLGKSTVGWIYQELDKEKTIQWLKKLSQCFSIFDYMLNDIGNKLCDILKTRT